MVTRLFVRLLAVSGVVVLLVWVTGLFVELHPDAYRDAITSVVVVYGLYLILAWVYSSLKSKGGRAQELWKGLDKTKASLLDNDSFLESVCEAFTLITLVNSLMMVTGYDTPKVGAFAYVHMLIRFLIVSMVIAVWKWEGVLKLGRDSIAALKGYRGRQGLIRALSSVVHGGFLSATTKLFTFITVAYCIAMVLLSSIVNPTAGAFFYMFLLALLAVITVFMGVIHVGTINRKARHLR